MLELSKIVKLLTNPAFLSILALIILSTFALKSLTQPGFYTSHDGETHTARIAQYYIALKDGQFPPRWAKNLNDTLGSPIFVYIYPLPYLSGSVLHFLGVSFGDSFKMLMVGTFVFSGIFAYLWLKSVWISQRAAMVGALFYIWVPYRFSLIYVRGSISESMAYTFLPLVLWSITLLGEKTNLKYLAFCSFSITLLLLSQNLVAAISIPLIAIYSVFIFIRAKNPKFFVFLAASSLWGFSLSAFTYIPALFERHFTHFNDVFYRTFDSHFVTLSQLIHSPWDYGFDLQGHLQDAMSFQIGLAHILVFIGTLIILPLALFKKKFKRQAPFFIEDINYFQINLSIFFAVVFIATIFLMLDAKPTIWVWDNFKPLARIDIPWRLLGITALAASFLAAFIAKTFKPATLAILMITAVLIANRNHLRINQSIYFADDHFLNYKGSATQLNEFTPKWRTTTKEPSGFTQRVEIIEGQVTISRIDQKSNKLYIRGNFEEKSRIQINLLYFPTWEVFMDGQRQVLNKDYSITSAINPQSERDNLSGLFEIKPPPGEHTFVFSFKETKLRELANLISLIAFTALISTIIFRRKFSNV